MATATAMYHTGKNPLRRVHADSETVTTPKGLKARRLHKAFLRYHDANNWPMLRDALNRMGRSDLIGNGKRHLVPNYQPVGTGDNAEGRRGAKTSMPFRTTHTRSERQDLAGRSRTGKNVRNEKSKNRRPSGGRG